MFRCDAKFWAVWYAAYYFIDFCSIQWLFWRFAEYGNYFSWSYQTLNIPLELNSILLNGIISLCFIVFSSQQHFERKTSSIVSIFLCVFYRAMKNAMLAMYVWVSQWMCVCVTFFIAATFLPSLFRTRWYETQNEEACAA